jgi:hypothetical protein
MLAGISVDYVVRLEQGRGPVPSAQVLGSLTRALRLDDDARDEVFHLAGSTPPGPGRVQMHVRPSVLRLIDRVADLPALVLSAKGDVLAWNAMSSALHGDWSALPPKRRNVNRLLFLPDPDDPPRTPVGAATPEDRAATAAHVVSGLRAAAARYPDDPDHPTVGPLVLDCDTLHVPDADQAVIVYSAESGTHEAEALALLRVLGTQSMEPSEP